MMNLWDAYDVDDDLLANGIWIEIMVGGTSAGRVRVRPADVDLNPEYCKGAADAGRKADAWMRKNSKNNVPLEVDRRLIAELFADSVITDWEVNDQNDQPIPCTKEAIVDLFVKFPKFYAAVKSRAQRWTNYRVEYEEKAVKP